MSSQGVYKTKAITLPEVTADNLWIWREKVDARAHQLKVISLLKEDEKDDTDDSTDEEPIEPAVEPADDKEEEDFLARVGERALRRRKEKAAKRLKRGGKALYVSIYNSIPDDLLIMLQVKGLPRNDPKAWYEAIVELLAPKSTAGGVSASSNFFNLRMKNHLGFFQRLFLWAGAPDFQGAHRRFVE